MIIRLLINPSLCYGCKTCQLACSYHHTGTFSPSKSSINICRDPMEGTIKWRVDNTCDGCLNEEEPLCLKYCVYHAIFLKNTDKAAGNHAL